MSQKEYAKVVWRPDDLIDVIAETEDDVITVEQAEVWLARNGKYIQEAMVRRGFEAIYDLLLMDPLAEEPPHQEQETA